MKKILQLSMVLLLFLSYEGFAQDRTITGTVTSTEDGNPLPGVTVAVKATTIGTVTDIDGKYALGVPDDANTLTFSYVGMETQEVSIGSKTTIDVALAPDVTQLNEVVVTALNIPREKASLGYATQTIDGEQVTKAKQQNFINSMSGKVAGVQIRTNSNFGGSTNIVIRGNKSITGSNQPLFVVDGVPIDNRTGNSIYQQQGRTGYDYGNAASDINPEDIASINILKGAAASALYGSRAANGVVMITTKKGTKRKGIGISFSTGVTASQINKKTFIEYQNEYGGGYGPYYGENNPYFYEDDVDGDGQVDLVVPTTEDASYGGRFDPNLLVYHWDSFVPESPNYQKKYPFTAAQHTPVEFFETQMEYNNTIALSGGNDMNTFRVSYTNYKSDWILPNSDMTRHNFSFSGSSKINQKLTANISANYVNNASKGRGSTGYGDNLMTNFRQWWQTNVDIKSLEDIYKKTGENYTWNPADYYDPKTPIFWDNPYWTRYKNFQTDNRSRVYGNFSLNYDVTPWLSVLGRIALDNYNEIREERRAIGSIPTEFGIPGSSGKPDQASGYQREERRVSEVNYDLIFTAKKDLSADFSLVGVLGTNIRRNSFESLMAATNGGLVVADIYSLDNSALPIPLPIEDDQKKEVYGFFANVSLGFKDMIYLELAGRNDISSALPVENNSYFYHSEALSFVFSKLLKVPFIDFGKVRVNYAEVGNDTDPNRTSSTYTRYDNFGSTQLYSFPTYVNNPLLEPERTKSFEVGLEMRGLNNRANLTLDLYNTNSVNQIVEVEISKAVGYGFKYLNGGNIQNKGIELALGYDIIKSNNFTWNASINWAINRSKVKSLPEGIENYKINDYQGGVSTNASIGQPYGIFRGTGFQYLNGSKVVNEDGYYVAVPNQIIGNPNPDWNGGFLNTLTYKGLALSFLIDMQQGGDVFSLDMHYGQATGLPEHTAGLNELGNPKRDPIADGGGLLFEGVQADGSVNTVRVQAEDYSGGFYWGDQTTNPNTMTMYDASYIKLREVSLGYSLPTGILGNVFQNAALSVVGRNLWIIHKNLPYADPESGLGAGNGQGYISGAYPSTRSLGVKLDLSF
ncbi:MAG TPA: SusC/RagA family TonB-linked outer membrane protein [Cytophagales bacterium]|nr:SusC/RagA family TonB-linked outer membrane protein [Cytophagales bacterium]